MPEIATYVNDDGSMKTFQARKYAVWTASKLLPRQYRRFDDRHQANKFKDEYSIGDSTICYYKPGKGTDKPKRLAFEVGGSLYESLVEDVSSSRCCFLASVCLPRRLQPPQSLSWQSVSPFAHRN